MDDTVRQLLRFVIRGFYARPYVLIIDALLLHSVLSEEDLSYLLGIQRKELRSLCVRLMDDRLIVQHAQRELPMAGQRPLTKTYYFIHNTEAIDAIKWKVHAVVQTQQKELAGEANPQGFICPMCKTKYSQLEAVALLNFEMNEFVCSLCNVPLIEDDSGKIAKENQEKYSRLMKQIEPIIDCLRKIDEHTIPENNFETSLGRIIPAQAATTAQYSVSNINKATRMFDRNSYLNNNSSLQAGARSQATLHVNISTEDGDAQREKLAMEQDEKRKQNALPSWHEQSTIGKSLGRLDTEEDEPMDGVKLEDGSVVPTTGDTEMNDTDIKTETDMGVPTEDVKPIFVQPPVNVEEREEQDALAAYYAKLEADRKEEEAEDDEELEFDDVDDDIEFDDVELEDVEVTTAPTTTATENKAVDDIVEELEFDSDEE